MANKTEGVLFDLDGTLVDTAKDLCAAVNHLLKSEGQQPLPFETLRPYVSQGGLKLVSVGFNLPLEDNKTKSLWHRYLEYYAQNLCVESCLFPGFNGILDSLDGKGIPWGIVTNKPERFTHPLLECLELNHRASSIVCGDTLPVSKPHPDSNFSCLPTALLQCCEHHYDW